MATITATRTPYVSVDKMKYTWAGFVANADVGTSITDQNLNDRSVQVTGSFAGSLSITIQGSNDGTNWFTLTDQGGSPLTFTAAGGGMIAELTEYVRPIADAGAGGGDADVEIFLKGRK